MGMPAGLDARLRKEVMAGEEAQDFLAKAGRRRLSVDLLARFWSRLWP